MTDQEIAQLLEPGLRARLEASGLETISVSSSEEFDGEPSIRVEAVFEGRGRSVDTDALLAAMAWMRQTLHRHGDQRSPHLQLRIPDRGEGLAA